jgi:translocation and assembly module TamB
MSASARPSEAPPRRRFRWLGWLVAALGVLLLLPVLAVGGALLYANTEGGRERIARLAASYVPGLSIEGLEGPLPGRLRFARLTMSDEQGVWLEVEGADLDWDPRALFRRELHVESLTARRIALHRLPPSSPEPEPPPEEPGQLIPELPQLPVSVRLDRLEVPRIELAEPVLGAPTVLRADARAGLDAAGLAAALRAAAEEGGTTLELDANLRPGADRLTARAQFRGAAGGPVSRLIGQPDRAQELDLTLDGPADSAALTLRASSGEGLSLDVAGTVRAPDTSRLGATLSGRADASGLLAGPLAALAGPLELGLDADGRGDGTFDLRGLRVSGPPGEVQAAGRLDPNGRANALRVTAAIAGSDRFAALLPADTAGWQAVKAEAEIGGALTAPSVAANVAVEEFRSAIAPLAALLGPSPRVTLRAAAPDRIEAFTLTGQALQAEARGRVGETLDLAFSADVSATEGVAPGLSGALRLSGTAVGEAANPTLTVQASSDRLVVAERVLEALRLDARIATPATAPAVDARATGRFQELPLSLDLRGQPDADGWLRLDAAEAALGPARLTANGRLRTDNPLFDGSATLAAPDLAPFAPLLGQPIAGAVRLEAQLAPRDGVQGFDLRLAVPSLRAAGATAERVTLTAAGTPANFEFNLAGRAQEVDAEARGRLSDASRLELAALRATGFGETIRLAGPARITRRPDGAIEIGALTLAASRGASLRAEGVWGPERADMRVTVPTLNLNAFADLAPDVAPAGTLSAEARVTGPTSAPEVNAMIRGNGLRAGLPAARGLPPGEVQVTVRRAGNGAIEGNGDIRLGNALRLAARASLPRGPAPDAPLEATLDGNADLAALAAPLLAAGADRVTGRLTLALRTSGPANAPQLGGEARLTGGSYRNGLYGVAITDLNGTLRPDGSRLRADITGRTAAEGRIALAGTIEPLTQYLPLDLTLTAVGAQPVAGDLIRTTLDAELRLSGLLGTGATLAGPVRIRRADIRLPDRLPQSVRTLGPVTERGSVPGRAPRPTPPRARPAEGGGNAPITLAVDVQAPRGVFVRGRGLDAELGGELAVRGRVDAPDITGELTLRRGEFNLLGKRLAFDRGRLEFQGGLLPALDFRAVNQSGSTQLWVEVTGTPNAPQITFGSTPELPQDEVLARLLFDRPLRDLSPFEIAQIAQAIAGATGVAGGGAAGILDRIRQGLGLDRLAVGGGGENAGRRTASEERTGPTLEAGRYVADGVYVGVRQGTEPGSSRVGVRVDLTPRLRLEAETGDREAGERLGVSMEWEWGR